MAPYNDDVHPTTTTAWTQQRRRRVPGKDGGVHPQRWQHALNNDGDVHPTTTATRTLEPLSVALAAVE
jgi:hypothetical protein